MRFRELMSYLTQGSKLQVVGGKQKQIYGLAICKLATCDYPTGTP